MKMDNAYFLEAFSKIEQAIYGNPPYLHINIATPILKQIARDQSEADIKKVESAIAEHFGDENEAFYFRAHGVGCDILAALREEDK